MDMGFSKTLSRNIVGQRAVGMQSSAFQRKSEASLLVSKNGDAKVSIMQSSPSLPTKTPRGKALKQVIAAFVANLGTINTGLVFGFSAVVIPQLEAADSSIPIDEYQASWIASLSSASTPVGCILSGYLMDNIGRKLTLILTEIPLIAGWILIASAQNVAMIYVGRLLVGLGSGMVGAPARVYTCEVTQPHLRGMLGALASVAISFGVLLQYTLGSIVTWQALSAVSSMIPIISLVSMLLMPESPNYLLTKDETDQARKSLGKLRGSTFNVDNEIDQMLLFKQKNHVQKLSGFRETIKALLQPSTLKPFGILVLYFMMYQFSGVNAITFYAVEIFQQSGTPIDKNTATIILGAVRLILTVVGCIALRKCGRRPMTFVSGVGCGFTMIGLGTYMYYLKYWQENSLPIQNSWFPMTCIFLFMAACTVGFLIVPWVMIGEVYPTQVRGIIGGLTTCCAHTCVFIVVKTYPYCIHLMYAHGTFWLYGGISLLGTIFFYLCLPETKDRTLQEIEDYFTGRTKTLTPKKTATVIATSKA